MLLHKPVMVLWEDIVDLPSGWLEIDEALDHEYVQKAAGYTVRQYGTLIDETEDYILVAGAVFEDKSSISQVSRIPIGCVKKIVYLEEKS